MKHESDEIDRINEEQIAILQILLYISQKDYEELEKLYKYTDRKSRKLDVIYGEIINELKDDIYKLQEKVIEKDRLYEELKEACKKTIMHYE